MSDASYIAIDGVTKRFAGGVIAVDDANVHIARGEFFSLLGPSGCGKTTLLRMIAGFEFPTEGMIAIEGRTFRSCPQTGARRTWCSSPTRSFRTSR